MPHNLIVVSSTVHVQVDYYTRTGRKLRSGDGVIDLPEQSLSLESDTQVELPWQLNSTERFNIYPCISDSHRMCIKDEVDQIFYNISTSSLPNPNPWSWIYYESGLYLYSIDTSNEMRVVNLKTMQVVAFFVNVLEDEELYLPNIVLHNIENKAIILPLKGIECDNGGSLYTYDVEGLKFLFNTPRADGQLYLPGTNELWSIYNDSVHIYSYEDEDPTLTLQDSFSFTNEELFALVDHSYFAYWVAPLVSFSLLWIICTIATLTIF